MSVITADDINKLRQQTGAGMMDCKKALAEAGGDFQEAIAILRKKGQKVSALRAGKQAHEGLVIAKTSSDGKTGIAVVLNCETDFVAKNESFSALAHAIADAALKPGTDGLDDLKKAKLDSLTIEEKIAEMVGKIGEKIELSRFEKLSAGSVVAYNHPGNRIGVLIALNKAIEGKTESVGKELAMQVAAMSPVGIDKDDVPSGLIGKEMEIAKEQARNEGKPENIIEKIAQGKLNKFFAESTLLNQVFVRDNSLTVRKFLEGVDKELKVTAFRRLTLQG